jgi:hypothetical protein
VSRKLLADQAPVKTTKRQKQPEPSENAKKASAHFTARKRVRGEEQVIEGKYMLTRHVHERWMLRDEAGALVQTADGDLFRTVVVDVRTAFAARRMARQFLISKGYTYDATELVNLERWYPNGEIPRHVSLISVGQRNELMEERFDFELAHIEEHHHT